MPTITFTTTSDQDTAIQYYTNQYNARTSPVTPLTPREYLQMRLQDLLADIVNRAKDENGVSRGVLASRASAADLATIDSILDKYK